MKRASIIKFTNDDRYVIYPINTLKGGGGKASPPYLIEENLTYKEVGEKLLETLEYSITDAPRPLDAKASKKHYLKSIGVKTMKELYDKSLNVGVFTKDGNYYISPSINKGPRQGFHGSTKDRIVISLNSSIDELAAALEEAFDKSS